MDARYQSKYKALQEKLWTQADITVCKVEEFLEEAHNQRMTTIEEFLNDISKEK